MPTRNGTIVLLDSLSATARDAAIAGDAQSLYVVGTDIRSFNEPIPENPLTAIDLRHLQTKIGVPNGRHDYVAPKAFMRNGALHLVWGDRAGVNSDAPAFRRASEPVAELWASRYSTAAGWSEPTMLISGARLRWRPSTSDGWFETRAAFGFAAPLTVGPGSGIAVIANEDGVWRRTTAPVPNGAASASVASDGSTIYLAYLAAWDGAGTDVNSVFLIRSFDNGRSWTLPQLISRSGSHAAYQLRAVIVESRLHLLWTQEVAGGATALRITWSSDSGASWASLEDVAVSPQGYDLRVSADACGTIHVVFIDFADGVQRAQLQHVMWRGGWSKAGRLFRSLSAHNPALATIGDGRTVLVFLGEPRDAGTGAQLRTYAATLEGK